MLPQSCRRALPANWLIVLSEAVLVLVIVIEGLGISATPQIDYEYDYEHEHERTNWQAKRCRRLRGKTAHRWTGRTDPSRSQVVTTRQARSRLPIWQ
jgi:hypothetical protein